MKISIFTRLVMKNASANVARDAREPQLRRRSADAVHVARGDGEHQLCADRGRCDVREVLHPRLSRAKLGDQKKSVPRAMRIKNKVSSKMTIFDHF